MRYVCQWCGLPLLETQGEGERCLACQRDDAANNIDVTEKEKPRDDRNWLRRIADLFS